jgi:hypothetical protein
MDESVLSQSKMINFGEDTAATKGNEPAPMQPHFCHNRGSTEHEAERQPLLSAATSPRRIALNLGHLPQKILLKIVRGGTI